MEPMDTSEVSFGFGIGMGRGRGNPLRRPYEEQMGSPPKVAALSQSRASNETPIAGPSSAGPTTCRTPSVRPKKPTIGVNAVNMSAEERLKRAEARSGLSYGMFEEYFKIGGDMSKYANILCPPNRGLPQHTEPEVKEEEDESKKEKKYLGRQYVDEAQQKERLKVKQYQKEIKERQNSSRSESPIDGHTTIGHSIRDHNMSTLSLQTSKTTNRPMTPMTRMTPVTPVSTDPGIVPQLQNIVSTVNLGCRLDLKKIALHARNAEYNPKRFAAVIMRILEPRTTALIYSSGKMVCTGAKSEEQSRLAARKYVRIVQKLGFDAKFSDFKIQNMVGSCEVNFSIRLEGLVLTHSQFASYEPDIFPGLIYRMVKPRIVLLIFVSGKVVLTGAKVKTELYEAFENIYPVLKEFRKQ